VAPESALKSRVYNVTGISFTVRGAALPCVVLACLPALAGTDRCALKPTDRPTHTAQPEEVARSIKKHVKDFEINYKVGAGAGHAPT
jgi:hypothetical protein